LSSKFSTPTGVGIEMDEAGLEELCNSLTSLRTQKDWRNKLQSCEQVAICVVVDHATPLSFAQKDCTMNHVISVVLHANDLYPSLSFLHTCVHDVPGKSHALG